MISPAAADLIRRCREQIDNGIAALHSDETLKAEVFFRAAVATLESLSGRLNGLPPLRRMALVVMPRDEEAELPAWMNRKVGDPDGAP